ncbi:MAG: ACP S-malonyltransferase [Clostridiales bacterium]|nr:ACP S-malonyltransferase [Clostridiales bacterium]
MGKIAFVFSGQGAQYSGMGKELFENDPAARAIFKMADDLRPGTSNQCFTASKEELSLTINTQPCLFTMDLACAAALDNIDIKAEGAAGFSLGEIAALTYTGMLNFEEGFTFVCKRAELMSQCAEKSPGAMAAVLKLDNEKVEELCKLSGNVYPVNFNCPGQVVAAGDEDGISTLAKLVTENGGKTMRLAVSGAFHSTFMKDASQMLESVLSNYFVKNGRIPLYSNATAEPYGENAAELVARQVSSPVLWQKTIENMIRDGFHTFIEVGAGKTLTSLIKKIDGNVTALNVENQEGREAVQKALSGGSHAEG